MKSLYWNLLTTLLVIVSLHSTAVCEDSSGHQHALIICGLPGDDEHREQFTESVIQLRAALTGRFGIHESRMHIQFGRWKEDDSIDSAIGPAGRSTSDEIAAAIRQLAATATQADTVWVFVIGHAYQRDGNSYLSIPERDISHREFSRLFDSLMAKQTLFFICTPASGPWIRELSGPGRIIATATSSGRETNGSVFHSAIATTFQDIERQPEFDLDEDGRVSLLDLYLTATRRVADAYRSNDPPLIMTEHALLDDNADRKGSELQLQFPPADDGADRKPTVARRKFKDGKTAAAFELPLELPVSVSIKSTALESIEEPKE